MKSGPARYTLAALGVAGPSGVAAWLAGPAITGAGAVWNLVGWFLMAGLGVVVGAWLVHFHGKPGAGFLGVLVAGILGRLLLAAAGAAGAVVTGDGAPRAYLVGVLAGFVPLQVFEVIWFHRSPVGAAGGDGGARRERRSPGGSRGEA